MSEGGRGGGPRRGGGSAVTLAAGEGGSPGGGQGRHPWHFVRCTLACHPVGWDEVCLGGARG